MGEPTQRRGFLLQCSLYFAKQEGLSDQSKITQFIRLLTWATVIWEKHSKPLTSYDR